MENEIKDNIKLPDNAFTELKEGEEYQPVMSPDKAYPEVNGWSVTWGVLMAILFSAAAAYLGLRVGQVFEAAIPIAIIAIILTWLKVPALAFALGMFIPIQLNIPLLIGGAVNWYVTTRSKNEEVNKERGEKGTLIASGFIAGGALMGVVSALLRFADVNVLNTEWLANPLSEVCSLVAYALIIIYLIKSTKKS